ncbi:exopolysaccharide biosynthesis protein, partial [Lactobacillus reuteri]|nr:exopolysaccharide biosynthesis protein [Limosilactobacillus reuteri]
MMIMKSELFDGYCEWLFGILNKVEEKLDISSYSAFHARVFGRISEILLDVWIDKNGIQYKEIPVMFMENQNWTKKIIKFLKAKF